MNREFPAAQAVTEPPRRIEPADNARSALQALSAPGTSHLLVCPPGEESPDGVVAALDIVDLVTHP